MIKRYKITAFVLIFLLLFNIFMPMNYSYGALPLAIHALGILFVAGAGYIASQTDVSSTLQQWWDQLTGEEQQYMNNVAQDGQITSDELNSLLLQQIMDKAPGKIMYVQNDAGNWVYRISLSAGQYVTFKGKFYVPTSLPSASNASNLQLYYKNPVSSSILKITVDTKSNLNTLTNPITLTSPISATEYGGMIYQGNGNEDVEFKIKAVAISGTTTIDLGRVKRYYVESGQQKVDYYNPDVAYSLVDSNIMIGLADANKVIQNISNKTINITNTEYVGVSADQITGAIDDSGILNGIYNTLQNVKTAILDLPNTLSNMLTSLFVPTVSIQTRLALLKDMYISKVPNLPSVGSVGSEGINLSYLMPSGSSGLSVGTVSGSFLNGISLIRYISRLLWLSLLVVYVNSVRRRLVDDN